MGPRSFLADFTQPVMGPCSFLAAATLSLVVTCFGGGETESVSVSESSVRHGNQLTCGRLGASPGEASFTGTLLRTSLVLDGLLGSWIRAEVQVKLVAAASCGRKWRHL